MSRRRAAAAGALALGVTAVVVAVALAVERFPRGVAVLACLWVALAAGWWALRRGGAGRLAGSAVTSVALTAAILVLVLSGGVLRDLLVVGIFVASVLLARIALRAQVELPPAPRPSRAVLFYNPLSGGGKATRFHLAEEARRRGIEPVELRPGEDLRRLVERAVAAGADALAMAGGDGSQAIVAEIAAANGLPYACIPAGTRNHFALDLGVDRNDVVGGLDALVTGGERRVDLAEVNGRVFVNNVSLGLYADAVQRAGYRDAKLRTLLGVAPSEIGSESEAPSLRWRDGEGGQGEGAVALVVSNNPYRLGTAIGSGTRPRLDQGVLGIAAFTAERRRRRATAGFGLRQWHAPAFTVGTSGPVAAGIDGEAAMLSSPVHFASRPGALRVRIAAGQPGASPSAGVPEGIGAALLELLRIAIGHAPTGRPPPENQKQGGVSR
jgi:diacylglycerol kinase family enzyme